MDAISTSCHHFTQALKVGVLRPGVQQVAQQRKYRKGGGRRMKSRKKREKSRKQSRDHGQPSPFSINIIAKG